MDIFKRFLACLFFMVVAKNSYSQINENSFYYAGFDVEIGTYFGLDASFTYALNKKYDLFFSLSRLEGNSKEIPENYNERPPDLILPFVYGPQSIFPGPTDTATTYTLGGGRYFNINKSGTLRVNAKIGVGYSRYDVATNFERESLGGGAFTLYEYSREASSSLSFTFNPEIELTLSKAYGLTLSPIVRVNKHNVYWGIGIGNVLGKLNP